MKVLFLADRLSVRGGADLHFLQIVEWAVSNGWEVGLAVGRIDSPSAVPEGVEIIRVRGLSSSTETHSRLSRLTPLLRSADVIHAQNVMNPEAMRRLVATGKAVVTIQDHRVFCPGVGKTMPDGSRCRQPLGVAECCVCLNEEAYRERMEKLTSDRLQALHGAALIVLSHYMEQELIAVGLRVEAVAPPWVDVGPPKTAPGDAFVLAGRLVSHKGVLDGWQAWSDAGSPVPLRIAGSGPLERELHGADSLGWVDHRRCVSELGQARALLFPTFWQEPFGLLGIESLANGTPVIASVSGGMADWTDAGCIAVEPGNVEGFSEAICRLADDPEEAMALGEAGRQMVAKRFSRDSLAPVLREVYEGRLR